MREQDVWKKGEARIATQKEKRSLVLKWLELTKNILSFFKTYASTVLLSEVIPSTVSKSGMEMKERKNFYLKIEIKV